jgi:DNA repair exonuclease SbcCD nuclease subunit
MRGFSFIHTADLHLDSPFSGLRKMDPQVTALVKDATFAAFEKVVDLALANGVAFLLVAGDVYDATDRSLRAQLKFLHGLKRLSDEGIRSFVCHGNHDPLDGWSASLHWPQGVHVFGSEVKSVPVEIEGEKVVRVHGISYPHAQIDSSFGREFQRQGPEPFQIGLFHCSVGSDPAHETYAPRNIDELVASNLDYWALGHVHTCRILRDSHPFIAYPGCTQGRHIRELGPRGCLVVRVRDSGEVTARFEPVDAVRWFSLELQIAGLETEGDLLEALEELCGQVHQEAQGRSAIVRISLSGRGPLHPMLRRPHMAEEITERLRVVGMESRPPVWVEEVQIHTGALIDLDARRLSEDYLGEVLRQIERSRQQPEHLVEVLSELYENRHGRRFLEAPDEEQLLRLLDEVESMCLDELVAEESG